MKKIFFVISAFLLLACSDSEKKSENNFYINLNNAYLSQISDTDIDPQIAQEAQALIQRAKLSGYNLIDAQSLSNELDDFNIIAALPRGLYNLGLIPNAKHFAFAKSMSFNENGSEWNWSADSLNRSQDEFLQFLGEDKNAKIVFYDEGDDIFAPFGRAHTAILWAKKLGYTNLWRLVGGFGAWKSLGLKTTTQMPECCKL